MVGRARRDQQPVNRILWQTVGVTVILQVIPAILGAASIPNQVLLQLAGVVLLHTLLQTVGTAVILRIVGLALQKVKAKIAGAAAQSGLAQAMQAAGVVEAIMPRIAGVVKASLHLPAFQQLTLPTTGRRLHLVVQLKRGQVAATMLPQVGLKTAGEPLEQPQKVPQLIAGPVHHSRIVGVVAADMVLLAPLMVAPLGLLLPPLPTIRASLLERVRRGRKANQQVRADKF